MASLIKSWVLGVFAVVYIGGAAMMYFEQGRIDFDLLAVIATLAATVAGFRFYFTLKPEMVRRADERRKAKGRLFDEACGEVAEAMSHLSRADFSVFITCHRMLERGEDSYSFRTSQGSPVHLVLVAMADARCTRPKEMKRYAPHSQASYALYELTDLGKTLLPLFLQDAAQRRFRRERAEG